MSIADKLTTIAENVEKVYQAGFDKGGEPIYYIGGFQYAWSSKEYPPNTDFVIHLKALGNMNAAFQNAINLRSVTLIVDSENNSVSSWSCFNGCKQLENIDLSRANCKFIAVANFVEGCKVLKSIYGALDFSEVTTSNLNLFRYAESLENIEFVPNTIGFSFEIWWGGKLSKASIISLINGLSDATSELTVTLAKKNIDREFETAEGLNDGSTSAEWQSLVATKQNWTISLRE